MQLNTSVENYLARVEKLSDLVTLACLLADQLKPDFFVDGKDPGYESRVRVECALRGAQEGLRLLKQDWMKVT